MFLLSRLRLRPFHLFEHPPERDPFGGLHIQPASVLVALGFQEQPGGIGSLTTK